MMLFQILLAILIGSLLGIITGLVPGVHINLVALLALASFPFLSQYFPPIIIAIAIASMAINHTFLDFIPSVFLGAPDSDTALSVLPAHRLLLKGCGYEAIQLATIGSLFGLIIIICLIPILIPLVKIFYPLIQNFIPYILILASSILILKEKNKTWALITFLLSGVLGLGVLNLPNLKQPLFPLLSGLFGISILFVSLKQKTKIPKQKITQTKIKKTEITKALSSSIVASSLCGFLPGLGAAQAAIIGSSVLRKLTTEGFIILVGAINTIVMIISFIALYTINKARSGAVVVISKILGSFSFDHFLLLIGATLVVGGIATFLTLSIAKIFSNIITRINYQRLCLSIIILIAILTVIFSGFTGFFILFISTCTGLIPSLKGIGKNHLMGCLILPVILYFLL